jgi:amidase
VNCTENLLLWWIANIIGGSIRVPAAYNFLYGLRPSHGRLPYRGIANSMEGQETVHSVCGPITHSIEGELHLLPSIRTKSVSRYEALHQICPSGSALEI